MEWRYRVLTQDHIGARLKEDTNSVGELLSISPGLAAVLLRHCQWNPERVQTGWYDDGEAFRAAVGLPPSSEDVSGPKELTRSQQTFCLICLDHRPTRSAGCSHYYCDECWCKYILTAVHDGRQCLSLRCPDPSCETPVVRELVAAVVHDADTVALYDQFALLSYVDDSGGRIRWCRGRGCSRAVELLAAAGGGEGEPTDVFCECGHGFCWACGEEPHRPVSCDEARAWLDMSRRQAAAPDDDEALLEKALGDKEELKRSWLENMAVGLGIEVVELGFLAQAYEEIAERWRVVRWMHAYGYYRLEPEREGDKCELFHRLLEDAIDSLRRLQACAEQERVTLCATEVEAMSEAYWAYKTKLMGLTGETRQHFDKLVRAVDTNFQDY